MKVVVICPTILANDAVGNATVEFVGQLRDHGDISVAVIARNSDRTDIECTQVASLGELLLDTAFREADVIVYVFAIYNELFDAMLIGNGHAAQIVRFHNVTPKAFVSLEDQPIVDLSLDQIQNFSSADELWADSQENFEELVRHGMGSDKIHVMPLPVPPLAVALTAEKPARGPLQVVYVGRFVPSKGLEDLISALGMLKRDHKVEFQARLIGSTRHSPVSYLRALRSLIDAEGLNKLVHLEGAVDRKTLADAYRRAHVVATASRHEGFCVPVIEGMAAGCVPVTYANSNLRHIAGGLGRLARTDTPADLSQAMAEIARSLIDRSSETTQRILRVESGRMRITDFDAARIAYVARFSPETCAARIRRQLAPLARGSSAAAA